MARSHCREFNPDSHTVAILALPKSAASSVVWKRGSLLSTFPFGPIDQDSGNVSTAIFKELRLFSLATVRKKDRKWEEQKFSRGELAYLK